MNKKERKELADKIRLAAEWSEKDHYYTCYLLHGLRMPYLIDIAVMRLYWEMFKPDNRGSMDLWFGSLMKIVRVKEGYRPVNNKEAQDHRVVALCMLAAIIETEGV